MTTVAAVTLGGTAVVVMVAVAIWRSGVATGATILGRIVERAAIMRPRGSDHSCVGAEFAGDGQKLMEVDVVVGYVRLEGLMKQRDVREKTLVENGFPRVFVLTEIEEVAREVRDINLEVTLVLGEWVTLNGVNVSNNLGMETEGIVADELFIRIDDVDGTVADGSTEVVDVVGGGGIVLESVDSVPL